MSKPRVDPTFGNSSVDVLILTERHPACRWREAQPGSCKERENLAGDAKGKGPSGIRHVGGAKLNLALVRNVRTWPAMPREKAQAAPTARPKVPMRRRGADCLVVVMKVL